MSEATSQHVPLLSDARRAPTNAARTGGGFKRTPVGVVPNEWKTVALAELSEFVTSGSRGWAAYYANQGALFVRSQNVRDGRLDFEDTQFVDPPRGSEGDRTRLRHSDVLITITGNSVGNVAQVEHDLGEAYISQHVGLVRLADPSCAPYVCRFLAPGSPGNAQIWASQSGQSKPGLTLKNLHDFVVVLPPPGERHAIVEALSDVDALLGALDRLIAKKRDLKQATMQQLLTGSTRLPGFQEAWTRKRLDDLFNFSGGYSASRAELSEEGHCYLHYGDIHGSTKTFVDVGAEQLDIPKLDVPLRIVPSGAILQDGDVVFVDASEDDAGTSKHIVVINENAVPFFAGLHTIVAKSKTNEIAHKYRRYCFQTPAIREQFLFYAVGTKVTGISKTNIRKLTLVFPAVDEQRAIAEILSDMDAELATLERRRDKTRALKQGMMQKLLTGRIRLV